MPETRPPDIVITEFIDAPPVENLRADADYEILLDETLWERPDDIKTALKDARAIIVRNRTQVTADIIAAAPQLQAIGRLGVGLDNIDLEAAGKRGIAVLPAVGANAASVAEYVLCSAMMLLRGSTFFGAARLAAAEWPRAEMSEGREIAGKVMGLIGFGSIGQTTADLARAAGFQTIAFDEFLPAGHEAWKSTKRLALNELLETADIVSLHCPLTPDTRGLLGGKELASMKPGAILINTARGGIVDETALATALRNGQIAGAALDVFDTEPIDEPTGALFAGLPNVILTPHVAGVTREANTRISALTVENVVRVLKERSA